MLKSVILMYMYDVVTSKREGRREGERGRDREKKEREQQASIIDLLINTSFTRTCGKD